jgi:DNA-binding CsgD family transcriptional regulator
MERQERLSRLTELIYDAALDPHGWQKAIEGISTALESSAGALLYFESSANRNDLTVIALTGYPDDAGDRYAAWFRKVGVRLPYLTQLPPGEICLDDMHFPFATFADFYRLLGLGYGTAANLFLAPNRSGLISFHRPFGSGQFTDDQIRLFRSITSHIHRAMQVQRQLANSDALATGLAQALESQVPFLLLSSEMTVICATRAAEARIAQPACPLRIVGGRLLGTTLTVTSDLTQAVKAALAPDEPQRSTPPVLHLPSEDGSRISIMVAPVRRPAAGRQFSEPLVLMFLSHGLANPTIDVHGLAAAFGLSPAEAQVAVELLKGEKLGAIASRRGVARETVRAQVKSLFAKTGTHGQAQLVATLLGSLAARREPKI